MDCLFCKIIKGDIPAEVVYEDDHAIAVMDVHPKALGHVMVLPRVHAETILELPKSEVGPVFQSVKAVTDLVHKKLSPDAFTIGINHGRRAGQTIDHLHIHIIPRFEGDGGGSIHSVVDNPPEESVADIAKRLRE